MGRASVTWLYLSCTIIKPINTRFRHWWRPRRSFIIQLFHFFFPEIARIKNNQINVCLLDHGLQKQSQPSKQSCRGNRKWSISKHLKRARHQVVTKTEWLLWIPSTSASKKRPWRSDWLPFRNHGGSYFGGITPLETRTLRLSRRVMTRWGLDWVMA